MRMKHDPTDTLEENSLFSRLSQILLRLVQFLLKQLHLASQVFTGSSVLVALVAGRLEVPDFTLETVDLLLGELQLVYQGRVFLLFLQEGLA